MLTCEGAREKKIDAKLTCEGARARGLRLLFVDAILYLLLYVCEQLPEVPSDRAAAAQEEEEEEEERTKPQR